MIIVAMKIFTRNQIVLGASTPHFSVIPFPVALISSSEVAMLSWLHYGTPATWIHTTKGSPLFRCQQLALKLLLLLTSQFLSPSHLHDTQKKLGTFRLLSPHPLISFHNLHSVFSNVDPSSPFPKPLHGF